MSAVVRGAVVTVVCVNEDEDAVIEVRLPKTVWAA